MPDRSTDLSRVAVVTLAHGRTDHLRRQQRALIAGPRPGTYVMVAMDDPEAIRATRDGPLADGGRVTTVTVDDVQAGLPLARARNLGAAAALAAGATTLVFLDVDCLPTPTLVDGYAQVVAAETGPALHCGVVRYLPPDALANLPDSGPLDPTGLPAEPHPARPAPTAGSHPSRDWELFWSLSFAVSAATWMMLGGFCEEYVGYGGEDTDFGYAAHRAGVDVSFTGGVDAYHQYHPTSSPPVQHLTDILRNAAVFHRRWGFWPMLGWLRAFADRGLAHYDEVAQAWRAGPGAPA